MPGKQIEDPAEVRKVIDNSEYAIVSMCDGGKPYAVPLNIAYDGEYFYAHSGKKGRKLEILRDNPQVSLTLVPKAELVIKGDKSACNASMDFESVCVTGTAEILLPEADREGLLAGLKCITERFGMGHLPMEERVLAMTVVIRIKADSIIGKRNPA